MLYEVITPFPGGQRVRKEHRRLRQRKRDFLNRVHFGHGARVAGIGGVHGAAIRAEGTREGRYFRITSYNVCYTKLLRLSCSEGLGVWDSDRHHHRNRVWGRWVRGERHEVFAGSPTRVDRACPRVNACLASCF